MYVRRDYSQPFFREKKKRPYGRWLVLGALTVAVGGFAYAALTQPAAVTATAMKTYQMLTEHPTATPFASALANQATDLYLFGDLEGAVKLFQQAVDQRPDNIDYLYEYGQILIDLDRPDEALPLADRITELAPQDARGLALRARTLVWRGDYSAAIPVGLSGVAIDPTFAPLYEALSRGYVGSDQWAEGLQYGEKSVDMAPGDVRAHWAYANALMAVGAREEAMVELEKAIELHPGFTPPYFELAFLYLSFDRDRDAIDLYDRILGMQPRNARALLRQCDAYRKIGEFERAVGLCQDAVNADPTYVAAQFRLGVMRYNRREFTQARNAFQACLTLEEGNLECQYRLGLAHYYVAQTTYQQCQLSGESGCNVRQECQQAWSLLEESLMMTQLQETDTTDTISIIREGMSAIAVDPACPGYATRLPAETTPEAENTPESDASDSE